MRLALPLFLALALLPIDAVAQTPGACGQMTTANVFIMFSAANGSCNENNPGACPAGQLMTFTAGAVQFGSSGYSFGCANHSFNWTIDGQSKTGQSVTHTFSSAGPKTVSLTINNGSQQFTTTATLNVIGGCGQMSNVNVYLRYGGTTSGCSNNGVCLAAENITFSVEGAGYDFGCFSHSFSWDFGDGSTAAGQDVSHTFGQTGTRIVSVTISNGSQTHTLSNTITLASCLPITIVPSTLPTGRVAEIYSIRFDAGGAPSQAQFSIAAGSMPPGLTLSANGDLSGSPTTEGTFNFTVLATAPNGCPEEASYELVIRRACQEITINPSRMPRASFGASYSVQLSASGGTSPYAYVIGGALPPGLTLRGDVITGVATTLGIFPFTVFLADADSCTASRALEIEVTLSSGCPLMVPGTNISVHYRGRKTGCSLGTVCQKGETIDFSVSTAGYDVTCGPHAFTWTFGDGMVVGGLVASHRYTAPGAYRAKLTISNAQQVSVVETDIVIGSGRRRAVRH